MALPRAARTTAVKSHHNAERLEVRRLKDGSQVSGKEANGGITAQNERKKVRDIHK